MLSIEEFVDQQKSLGRRIHKHDGVFWEEVYPFYCKPAFIYQSLVPREVRPARRRSILGYSHQVHIKDEGNRLFPVMVLERKRLDDFSLSRLPQKKRNQVRRALEHCVIKPITDIDQQLERMREINISQSLRQEQGAGAETPKRRYIDEADEWRTQMRRQTKL